LDVPKEDFSVTQTRTSLALTLVLTLLFGAFFATTPAFAAASDKVLYSFCDISDCEGYEPYSAPLVMDAAGNLYGTAAYGGTYNDGVVFELSPTGSTWAYSVLYYFGSQENDGAYPLAGLVFDGKGNLYGTTQVGGANGSGTVFELTPTGDGTWTETILFGFDSKDGANPQAGVVFDPNGNLYGTTYKGGTCSQYTTGCGVVFELEPGADGKWTEKVLHKFQDNNKDGIFPTAGVILDGSGNVYGTTLHGGPSPGYGTAFELSPATGGKWTYKIIHDFSSTNGNPAGPLVLDSSGNLYGTSYGGSEVFELTPGENGAWTYKPLTNLNKSTNGEGPYCGLTFDKSGNLYGTAVLSIGSGNGQVFELVNRGSGKWVAKVVYTFDYNPNGGDYDGSEPFAGVILDANGNIYGVTSAGGTNNVGTVFEVTP
jgi:uncharacterized repeat protein (TIGR03803 family)